MNTGGKNMELKCDEDGCGGKLELDNARGEAVCGDCGVVFENMLTDADTNSGSSLGENRHNEAVNSGADAPGAKHGTRMNVWGDQVDAHGNRLDKATIRKFRDLARKDRATQRDTDPMYTSLMATIQEMFGADMARAVELLARATGRKLKPWQEARRRTLGSNEKRMLKCPKTAICRAGGKEHPELRGATEKDNLQIMALAIASIASKWFHTITINEKMLMESYGITQKQFVNAKKIIRQHYMARIRMKWAPQPKQLHAAAAREDEMDKAAHNLEDALASRLAEADLGPIMDAFFEAMSDIGEPSVDATTSNVPIPMVAGCVMYKVLQSVNKGHGNLNTVAKAVNCSGAGLKSRLANMEEQYNSGKFPGAETLFGSSIDEAKESSGKAESEEESEE